MPKFIVPGVERRLYSPYNKAIPELRNGSGLMAPSSFDIMEARTRTNLTKYSRRVLMEDNYATVDALIIYKNRSVIRLDAPYLREITPKGRSRRGAIEMDNTETFENIAGVRFIIGETRLNTDLTPDEARMDPIWQVLARGNQDVLDAYVDAVFGELDEHEKGMRISISDATQNIPRMRYVELTGSRENFAMNGSTKVGDITTVLGFKETRQRSERRRSLEYTVPEPALG